MTIKIITADERLARRSKINVALFGPSGIGKTTLARSLDPESTLVIDLESGTLALQDWGGDVLDVREQAAAIGADPWEFARGLVCLLSGPDPADHGGAYSRGMYDAYAKSIIDPAALAKYSTIFIDSITVASRHCFAWARRQPEAFSEKTGKPDVRGAYGLMGREMIAWLTMAQHTPGKSIIAVGILDRREDDLGRVSWEPQIEGSKTARELPGIFDQVITMQYLVDGNGEPLLNAQGRKVRGLFTAQDNPEGYPAKDRSGRLDPIEEPHLGKLMKKISTANSKKRAAQPAIDTTIPSDSEK